MERDRLGRRRRPGQERGLRPMHPELPRRWESRALRVAMSEADWARFDALAGRLAPGADTRARAFGEVLSYLLQRVGEETPEPIVQHWQDWERRKALRLLFGSGSRHAS